MIDAPWMPKTQIEEHSDSGKPLHYRIVDIFLPVKDAEKALNDLYDKGYRVLDIIPGHKEQHTRALLELTAVKQAAEPESTARETYSEFELLATGHA